MSGRNGVGQIRGTPLGPQPLRATIPYQLHSKARPNSRDAGKTKSHQLNPGMRRTVSLDAIVGPYLQGHWPKEPEGLASLPRKDKSTQTPDSWSDEAQSKRGSCGHQRSASWGSAEHLQEIGKLKQQLQQRTRAGVSGGHDKDRQLVFSHGTHCLGTTQTQPISIPLSPLYRLAPRLRRSVEGFNQELEGVFICQPPHHQRTIPEIPDGHRAPVPPQNGSRGSQSEPPSTPFLQTDSSPCSSPSCLSSSSSSTDDLLVELDPGVVESAEVDLPSPLASLGKAEPASPLLLSSSPLLLSSSPWPNKSYCFQREPPEGCEKVRVWEELSTPLLPRGAPIASCPDPNKVNFTPHGGSAFCPVSLLKPLLPSMDLLFRSLTISPVNGCSGQDAPYQTSPSAFLGPHPDSAAPSAM